MTLNYSTPVVNPRLGSSFAIFASTYVCLVLMLVILEQLGLSASTIDQLIVITPAFFYVAIGFMTRTINMEDFFISGQRVPALYNALSLSAMVFGGSILLGSIGSFFFIGIDALAIPLGCFAGLILMAVLFVPYLRKAGAYTVPGYLNLRFGRRSVRVVASLLMLVPCGMILIAEVSLGSKIIAYFLPPSETLGLPLASAAFFVLLAFGSVFMTVSLGGMRSATWTQCAQFIVFLGILAPLVAVSVLRTNLPLPQLTYGGQLEASKALEPAKNLSAVTQPQPASVSLPKAAFQPIANQAEAAFTALRPMDFALIVLCLAMGIAVHPAFVPRISTTPTIVASRKTFGWIAVIAAFIVITIPAYAFFVRAMTLEQLVGLSPSEIPAWGRVLQQLGFVSLPVNQFDPLSASSRVTFQRDTIALVLPVAGSLPRVFLGIAAAAALAALSACAAGHLVAIANTVSDDLYHGAVHRSASNSRRFLVARLTMILCGVMLFVVAQNRGIDPLRWVIGAFSVSAGTFFAVLVLSVWWRRLSAAGAFVGMITGFLVTALYLYAGGTPLFGVDALTAAAIGVPASFASAIIVSLVLVKPDGHAIEAVEDLRVPAGETLQTRMSRLAARSKPVHPN